MADTKSKSAMKLLFSILYKNTVVYSDHTEYITEALSVPIVIKFCNSNFIFLRALVIPSTLRVSSLETVKNTKKSAQDGFSIFVAMVY